MLQGVDKRFAIVQGRKVTKPPVLKLLCLLPDTISKAEICAPPDISPTTVEAVLGKMVKEGRIKRLGAFRNARYVRNE